jgi:cell division transport system permease protein
MNIFYFVKEAFRGFFHAKVMTAVSCVIIGLTLFFLGTAVVAYVNIRNIFKNFSERIAAVVYIKDDFSKDSLELLNIYQQIKKLPEVKNINIVNKQAAWERFKSTNDSMLLSAVDENPFPVSIEISFYEKYLKESQLQNFYNNVKNINGIEDVVLSNQEIKKLNKYKNLFFSGALFFCIILVIASNVMIGNTIKLTIYARRELIRNMHYVGATKTYIKLPFIFEGILQGIIGGLLGGILLISLKASVSVFFPITGSWFHIIFLSTLIGAIFGWLGSLFAVRKFLI